MAIHGGFDHHPDPLKRSTASGSYPKTAGEAFSDTSKKLPQVLVLMLARFHSPRTLLAADAVISEVNLCLSIHAGVKSSFLGKPVEYG